MVFHHSNYVTLDEKHDSVVHGSGQKKMKPPLFLMLLWLLADSSISVLKDNKERQKCLSSLFISFVESSALLNPYGSQT